MSNFTENRVIDKTSEFKVDDEMREKIRTKIGYLIIQEFPKSNISYVIGYNPYGKVWFDYEEVLIQYAILMENWQKDFDNNEIENSKTPRIVKIFIMDDDDIAGSDPRLNKTDDDDENDTDNNEKTQDDTSSDDNDQDDKNLKKK
jgi:hypothetical protein